MWNSAVFKKLQYVWYSVRFCNYLRYPRGVLLLLIAWKQMILHKAFFYYDLIIDQNE